MNTFTCLKHTAIAAVIATPLIIGFATLASAHSFKACINDIINFCTAAHGDAAARHACIQSGAGPCNGHGHPGGSVPPAPDPNMTSNPGHPLNKTFKFKRR